MKEDEVFQQDFENAERVGYLVAAYIKGTLTHLERKELDEWILQSNKNELLFDELTSDENIQKTMEWYAAIDEQKALRRIKKKISFTNRTRRNISFPFMAIAASLILIAGALLFFYLQKNKKATGSEQPIASAEEVMPANNKAVLTIGGGRKIVLDSTAPKNITEGNITINPGALVYDTLVVRPPQENTLTVPRGGQFTVVLPDGTKVWLNAASSLTYLSSFVGKERRVALTGEAYFEVTKNKEKPFIVTSSGNEIKVLGTKFNANSYGDEKDFTTTLLEGSVQLTAHSGSRILKPGEEGRISGDKIEVLPVNTEDAVGWKERRFVFRNATVHSIVLQLELWYDIDVEFRDAVDKHLNATIERDVPLSKVLHYLEQTGDVHFKLEGRKLLVMH